MSGRTYVNMALAATVAVLVTVYVMPVQRLTGTGV